MKAFNYPKLRPIFLLVGLFVSALTAHAAVPEINSPLTANATVGESFVYTITTTNDDALNYGTSVLPDGLTRNNNVISGTPTAGGISAIRLNAANADGSAVAKYLVLTISNPVPVISSSVQASGRVGQSFLYQITATNSPDSYTVIGLPAGLDMLDATTGLISGVPTEDADADVLISATNAAGTSEYVTLNINILPEITAPNAPTVNITTPINLSTFEGNTSQITVTADVTPAVLGEGIGVVYVRWTNPDPLDPTAEIILSAMTAISTDPVTETVTYSADLPIGFNPDDREIGGGLIQFDVVAYPANAVDDGDAGIDSRSITVKPILEFLFPEETYAMDSVEVGDVFASARLSTNDFFKITARIAGSSLVETIEDIDNSDNQNGVFNFAATKRIDYPGYYDIRIVAEDNAGNITTLERRVLISDSLAEPVATITSPTPGFTNEVFSSAIFRFAETNRAVVSVQNFGVIGYDVTYALTLVSGGQGYYPRNDDGVTLTATDATGITLGVPGITITNGRVTSLPDEFTIFYQDDGIVSDPQWNTAGNALMDDLTDPGRNAWVSIAAQFFKANSELDTYKIFVNGEDVTPGTGNYDPNRATLDVPVLYYPGASRGSPAPGDYIVYAQVTDKQGEVGTSEPLTFSILPYEPLEMTLTREGAGDVEQGSSLAYYVEVSPSEVVETVEFFDSESGESVGFASSVTINGVDMYRYIHDFNSQGEFGLYAVATAFNGQTSTSTPIRVTVTPINDLSVSITTPVADTTLVKGQSLTFAAVASASPGVASVAWVVGSDVIETDTTEPYEFTRVFDVVATNANRVIARATDNFGNIVDSDTILVTVTSSDVSVSITSPSVDQTVFQGESLTFISTASASVGVDRVEWSVNGVVVETDTASPYSLTHEFAVVGSSTVTARAYDSFGNTVQSSSIGVQVSVSDLTVSITSPLVDQALVQGESLTFTATAAATVGVDRVEWTVDGVVIETDSLNPYSLTYEFAEIGSDSVVALAYDSFGNSASSSTISVQVSAPNALLRDQDFVSDIYQRLVGRSPTTDELTTSLASLDGTVASRAALLVELLQSDSLESSTIASLIFRTMTGEWPDSSELADALSILTNDGTGAVSANTLTTYLIPEYEARFAVLNTELGFVKQLFKNKHGVVITPQSENRLYNSAIGESQEYGGLTIPGYLGDTVSYATQFALDNDSSGYMGVDGFPLSSLHLYSMPNQADSDSLIVVLISSLLGVEPTQTEIDRLKALSLTAAATSVLTDSRYYSSFPTSTPAGYTVLKMAELGVFSLSLNGDSDDADGDGVSNIEEILLNTSPVDGADEPVSSGATSIDGTDFVMEFVRLKTSETPDGISVVVECSTLSNQNQNSTWTVVPDLESKISLASDQSGIGSDYERVEFRVDMTSVPCNFFRLSVQ